jgi:hypothetical protein
VNISQLKVRSEKFDDDDNNNNNNNNIKTFANMGLTTARGGGGKGYKNSGA